MEATEKEMACQGPETFESVSKEIENVYREGDTMNADKRRELLVSSEERGSQYPQRPLSPDCVFYLRSGYCRYGPNCRFNHPPKTLAKIWDSTSWADQVAEKNPDRTRKMECRFYMLPGGCRYGHACKFAHFPEKSNMEQLRQSLASFPFRPGGQDCLQYMHAGYSMDCKFQHLPVLSSVASEDLLSDCFPLEGTLSGCENGESAHSSSLQLPEKFRQLRISTDSISSLEEELSYSPQMLTHQIYYDNGYQDSATSTSSSSKQDVPHAHVPNGAMADRTIYQQMNTEEHAESPTGADHAYRRLFEAIAVPVGPTGLPLRPDQPVCIYYSRLGLCKYGIGCQYDHPVSYNPAMTQSSNKIPTSTPDDACRT